MDLWKEMVDKDSTSSSKNKDTLNLEGGNMTLKDD
jgi:hypothetical protein